MKIIGVITGEYNGNKYGKLITTEPLNKSGSAGINAVISKCQYQLALDLVRDWALYEGQDCIINYDRYGKVQAVQVM